MASQQYQNLVKANTLFFKPIHSKSFHDKLMIPRKFVKKYGDVLSDTVFLKLPNGEEWKVKLGRRNNGDIWFESGWKEFAEYHSLLKGRLLVFGCDNATSHCLSVLILDLTTSEEIEYPSNNGVEGKHQGESSCGTRKNKPPLSCLLQKSKKDKNLKRGHNVDTSLCSQDAELYHTIKKCKAGSQRDMLKSKVLKVKDEAVNKENMARALERAKAFQSQSHYPSFILVARPSYINTLCNITIPSGFGTKFLASKKSGQITNLRTSNGRVWITKFSTRKQNNTTKFELSLSGWRAFVKDNDLKVDDVCVFELIKGSTHDINFWVSIFPNSNPSDDPLSQATGKNSQKNKRVKIKSEAQEFEVSLKKHKFTKATSSKGVAAHSFNSDNPFFKITIGLSHGQAIPANFLRKYWEQGEHVVKLQVRDKMWRVKLIRTCGWPDYGFFSEGWAAFGRDNDLQVGDNCFFELSDIHVIKVHIFKRPSS